MKKAWYEKMRNIKCYTAKKYLATDYMEEKKGIYRCNGKYVTSLSFVQEPEFGEGCNAAEISQYPLEDILDKFFVYVSDFYPEQNKPSSDVCYLEFCSPDLEDILKLQDIIGKHVYNQTIKEYGSTFVKLIIE